MPLYHHSVIPENVKEGIYKIISSSTFTESKHARERRVKKNVKPWQYIARHGTIVEFNVDRENPRNIKTLLRTPDGHVASFGLKSKIILTYYWNNPNDNHKTLDTSKYEGGINYL